MKLRHLALLSSLFLIAGSLPAMAQQIRVMKIAHQYPAAANDDGDFRDRLCKRFASEVEKRSNGTLRFEVYPQAKLVKPDLQLDGLKSGSLEFCLSSLNNMFAAIPELNVTQLPGVIRSYEQGFRWKTEPIGRDINALLEKNGAMILTWVWQPAGIVAVVRPVLLPDDLRDFRVRGGGGTIDSVLKAVGAKPANMSSNEIPKAFREHRVDAAITSSTSLVSFQIQDLCRAVTTPRQRALFYFLEPLLISKVTFDSLTPEQKKIVAGSRGLLGKVRARLGARR